MDRLPLPPPFAVGTRLRYHGTMRSFADREMTQPLQYPGMEIVIDRVKEGRQGTGRVIEVDEYTDEEIRDTTRDGYSVWTQANGHGRLIDQVDAKNWEVL